MQTVAIDSTQMLGLALMIAAPIVGFGMLIVFQLGRIIELLDGHPSIEGE
jgi:hypothetical protein